MMMNMMGMVVWMLYIRTLETTGATQRTVLDTVQNDGENDDVLSQKYSPPSVNRLLSANTANRTVGQGMTGNYFFNEQ